MARIKIHKKSDNEILISQLDSYGREQKMYEITRDGFSLLVMGFAEKKH